MNFHPVEGVVFCEVKMLLYGWIFGMLFFLFLF